jgi:hypothetical protein
MNGRKSLVGLILACSSVTLGGCAETNQFGPPIETFSTASTNAAASFKAIDTQVAAQYTTTSEDAAAKIGRVEPASGDCQLTSKGCVIVYRSGGQTNAVYASSLMPKSVAFMNGVAAYASALNAIEKADASANVQTALNQGLAAISTMAGVVNAPAAAAISAIQKPLVGAAIWAFGQYQNSLKLQALQTATQAAEPVIQSAKPILVAEIQFAGIANTAALKQDLNDKDDAFSKAPTAKLLQAEIASANALNTALAVKPDFFGSLAAAHTQLTAAIKNPEVSPADAISAITAFYQQVANVEQVAKTLK